MWRPQCLDTTTPWPGPKCPKTNSMGTNGQSSTSTGSEETTSCDMVTSIPIVFWGRQYAGCRGGGCWAYAKPTDLQWGSFIEWVIEEQEWQDTRLERKQNHMYITNTSATFLPSLTCSLLRACVVYGPSEMVSPEVGDGAWGLALSSLLRASAASSWLRASDCVSVRRKFWQIQNYGAHFLHQCCAKLYSFKNWNYNALCCVQLCP